MDVDLPSALGGLREKSRIPYSCGDEGKRGMVVELPNKAFYLEDAPLS
jgi:hypothetical protein